MSELVADSIDMTFHTPAGEAVHALKNVSFSLQQGELLSVLGPSGCGKTTLLNLIAGFLRPTGGLLSLNGDEVDGPGVERGMVFQQGALFEWLTVAENVNFGLRMKKHNKAETARKVEEWLEIVGLQGFGSTPTYQLSGGMQQRVALARCLINDPDLILMDEPLGALDALTREKMQSLVLKIWKETGKTIMIITHSVEEALLLGERLFVMAGWHWVYAGVASILVIWFYFSWDAARSFFPKAANELCQVARVDTAINPMRSVFPIDSRLLKGTSLLARDGTQLKQLDRDLAQSGFTDEEKAQYGALVAKLRGALVSLAAPENLDPEVKASLSNIAQRVDAARASLADPDNPGPATAEELEEAAAQPGWGESTTEIPTFPITDRGRNFASVVDEVTTISKDFIKIRNTGGAFNAQLEDIEVRWLCHQALLLPVILHAASKGLAVGCPNPPTRLALWLEFLIRISAIRAFRCCGMNRSRWQRCWVSLSLIGLLIWCPGNIRVISRTVQLKRT